MFNMKHRSRMFVSPRVGHPNSASAAETGSIMCSGINLWKENGKSPVPCEDSMNAHVLCYKAPCLKPRHSPERSPVHLQHFTILHLLRDRSRDPLCTQMNLGQGLSAETPPNTAAYNPWAVNVEKIAFNAGKVASVPSNSHLSKASGFQSSSSSSSI